MLTACGTMPMPGFMKPGGAGIQPPTKSYACTDGRFLNVQVSPDRKSLHFTLAGLPDDLKAAESPFGERFVGEDEMSLWLNQNQALVEWPDGDMLRCVMTGAG